MYYDRDKEAYIEYCLLSNKQTAGIVFYEELVYNVAYITIAFGIANKKNQLKSWLFGNDYSNLELHSTGKSLEGLIWAKNTLIEFENNTDYKRYGYDMKIIVQGADNRRLRVYERYLKRYGYKKVKDPFYGWCLFKYINNREEDEHD